VTGARDTGWKQFLGGRGMNAREVHKQSLPLPGAHLQRARPRRALDLPRALAGPPIIGYPRGRLNGTPGKRCPDKSATMQAQYRALHSAALLSCIS
jgi:hypothetical protein